MITKFQIFEKLSLKTPEDVKGKIMRLKNLPKELKDVAVQFTKQYTHAENGKVTGLNLHPDLRRKISDKGLPDGFDMGVDKNGYFIHTHRARSHSHETPDKITVKEINFIDSTG
jgi:hypothetical protein